MNLFETSGKVSKKVFESSQPSLSFYIECLRATIQFEGLDNDRISHRALNPEKSQYAYFEGCTEELSPMSSSLPKSRGELG